MGAIISLPISLGASAAASCLGTTITTGLCSLCGGTLSSSLATRGVYALWLLFNSILSWASLNNFIVSKLDLLRSACEGEECTSFTAVHRINASLGLIHVLMAVILASIPAAAGYARQTKIQNGYWRLKFAAWILILVGSFFLPAEVWVAHGNYIAPLLSFIFVFIGLVLLVDFAHSWAETCVRKVEESENSKLWQFVLIGSSVSMYLGALILTIIMYWFFASEGCSMNQAAITLNVIFIIITSVLSVHPRVQEYNPQAGLAQSAMVAFYCTYLTISAVSGEPDDRNCNPLVRSKGTRTATIVLGALFTFVAIAYTTTRAASRSMGIDADEDDEQESAAVLRTEALRQAVREGTLPESALNEEDWHPDTLESSKMPSYNYILFHIVFLLATQYTATLLTMNVEKDPNGHFVPVGRTYFACWMKIVSSWICYGLYSWTLAAPAIFPDRFQLP